MRQGEKRQDTPEDALNGSRRTVEAFGSGHERPDTEHEEAPRVLLTRGRILGTLLFVVSALAFLYFVLPKLLGLHETWDRIQHGNGWWFGLAAVLEVCSFFGYVWLFRGVFVRGDSRIDWPRELPDHDGRAGRDAPVRRGRRRRDRAHGVGAAALGHEAPRTVARRLIAFTVILYAVYMITLVIDGVGLYLGVIPGGGSFAITIVPGDLRRGRDRRCSSACRRCPATSTGWSGGGPPASTALRRLVFRAGGGVGDRGQRRAARRSTWCETRNPSLLGAVAWWGFDIAVLWACFHAFGGLAAEGRDRDGVLRRDARQHAAAPGRDRGRRRRHDRRVRRRSAWTPSCRSSPCSPTARSRSGCRRCPGAVAYLQLRRTVQRWGAEKPTVLRGASDPVS